MTIDEALKEIETLKADKEALTTKNSELTTNLTNQRKTHEAELKERDEKLTAAETTIKEFNDSKTQELTDYQEKRVNDMAKGDETIKAKILEELGNIKFDENTREGIDAGALRAFQLATAVTPDALAQRADSVTPADGADGGDDKLTPATKEVYDRMFPAPPTTTQTT